MTPLGIKEFIFIRKFCASFVSQRHVHANSNEAKLKSKEKKLLAKEPRHHFLLSKARRELEWTND